MALPKKNQLTQILFLMVDPTDFATIESALTAMPTGRFFGVNHGGSVATVSGALSKTISHVRSGLYRATIKAAEANYDFVDYRFIHASAADQHVQVYYADADDSDILSAVVAAQSDLRSLIITTGAGLTSAAISDIASAVWQMAYVTHGAGAGQFGSLLRLAASRISDTQSYLAAMSDVLSDFYSDFQSRVPKLVATASQLSDLHSDLRSYLVVLSDQISDLNSDMRSLVTTTGVALNTATISDLKSAIAAPGATLTTSDISDIASAVWAAKYTVHTAGSGFGSLLRAAASGVSDTQSYLVVLSDVLSDFYSDFQSRVPKLVATASQVSDLHSDLRSYLVGAHAQLSDAISNAYSAAAQFGSTFIVRTGVTTSATGSASTLRIAGIAHDSQLNGYHIRLLGGSQADEMRLIWDSEQATSELYVRPAFNSAVAAGVPYTIFPGTPYFGVLVSDVSDIASAVWAATYVAHGATAGRMGSLLRAAASGVSDTRSYLVALSDQISDLNSDLRSLITTTGVGLNSATMSDIRSAIAIGAVTLGPQDLIDIASAVWFAEYAVNSSGSTFGSLVRKVASGVSDTQSYLVALSDQLSDLNSDMRSLVTTTGVALNTATVSDLKSAIAAVGGGTITQSDISNIASAVWAAKYTAHSLASSFGSMMSDIFSRAGTAPAGTLTVSDISDIASAVWVAKYITHSTGSGFGSLLRKTASGVSDTQSYLVAMSDILSDFYSDFQSRVPKLVATNSQLSDLHSDLRSLVTTTGVGLNTATVSDLKSAIAAGAGATITTSDISNIASAVWAHVVGTRVDSNIVLTAALESNFYSDFQSRVPKLVATASQLSDLHSDLRSLVTTTGVGLNTATVSDLKSAITAGGAATITTSDISNIASAVWAAKYTAHSLASSFGSLMSDIFSRAGTSPPGALTASDISDIASAVWVAKYITHSTGSGFGSLLRKTASGVSDTQSYLVALSDQISDLNSDMRSLVTITGVGLNTATVSDLKSAIAAGAGATITTSDISNIASAVWAHVVGTRVDSNIVLTAALESNFYSDFQSRVPKAVATASQLTAAQSDTRSYLTGLSGMLTDVHSAAVQANSRAQATFDVTSDIYSLLSDVSSDLTMLSGVVSSFESDFQSRFPATIPELTGDPGDTPTWAQAEALVFGWLKNDTTGTPTKRLLKDGAGSTVLSGLVNWDASSSIFSQGRLG